MIDYASLNAWVLAITLSIGLFLLFFGGEWLAKAGASLAVRFKINPVVVGLTIVAIATSMPELITSFYATAVGSPDIAVGNVVGSNIVNISFIIGIAALIYPMAIHAQIVKKEMPILMGVTLLFFILSFSGSISRVEGVVLIAGMVLYLIYIVRQVANEAKDVQKEYEEEVDKQERTLQYCLFFIFAGAILLHFGADFLVGSSIEFARRLGMSEALIGLTIVAVGTSLPELAASVAAARKGHSDICAGNIVGSNLFNILLIIGGVSIVQPLEVNKSMLYVDFPAMLFLTGLIWYLFSTDRNVSRVEGLGMVVVYFLIMGLSALSQYGMLF